MLHVVFPVLTICRGSNCTAHLHCVLNKPELPQADEGVTPIVLYTRANDQCANLTSDDDHRSNYEYIIASIDVLWRIFFKSRVWDRVFGGGTVGDTRISL